MIQSDWWRLQPSFYNHVSVTSAKNNERFNDKYMILLIQPVILVLTDRCLTVIIQMKYDTSESQTNRQADRQLAYRQTYRQTASAMNGLPADYVACGIHLYPFLMIESR